MNPIYLIRHGQAGTRDEYDRLSSLGQTQARALGAWLAGEGVHFDEAWTGGLRRQRDTATLVLGAMAEAGSPQPEPHLEPRIDPRWNEFDLDAVYAALGPRMAAEDPAFRTRFEALQQAIKSGDAKIHRTWTSTDTAVVQAWVAGRYPFEGESWIEFVARVQSAARERLFEAGSGRRVAVFTSATPVAITLGLALPIQAGDMMRLAGTSMNSNVTILNVDEGQPQLFAFNWAAHLENPEHRTFR